MNIEIVGHVVVDHNVSEQASYTAAGSLAMFMKRIYGQLPNCQVGIIAPYGPDYLSYLHEVNIYPWSPNRESTLVYENVSKRGTRTQKALNREQGAPVPVDSEVGARIEAADIVIFAPLLPNYPPEYYAQVLAHAKRGSLRVLLPQGYYRDFDSEDNVIHRKFTEADQILSNIDLVIVSEQDGPNMLATAKQWALRHGLTSLVTLGEKGAVAFTKDGEVELPTVPLTKEEIVDSVGSGDIFSAFLAYKLRQSGDIRLAGKFANAVARQALFYTADQIRIDLSQIN